MKKFCSSPFYFAIRDYLFLKALKGGCGEEIK